VVDIDVRAPVFEVQWDGESWSDITGDVVAWRVQHGSAAYGNPDRPIILGGYGDLQAYGAVAQSRLGRRFAFRATLDDTLLWAGWITEPDVRPGPRPITRWRLAGLVDDKLDRRRSVSERSLSSAEIFADANLWTRLVGNPVTAPGLASRALTGVSADQQVGGFISRLAAVTSTEPVATRDGHVRFCAPEPSALPAGMRAVDSRAVLITAVESADRADRIRNYLRIDDPDIPGSSAERDVTLWVMAPYPQAATVSETFELESSGTVEGVAAEAVDAPHVLAATSQLYVGDSRNRYTGYLLGFSPQPAEPADTADLTHAVDGREITITCAIPAAHAPSTYESEQEVVPASGSPYDAEYRLDIPRDARHSAGPGAYAPMTGPGAGRGSAWFGGAGAASDANPWRHAALGWAFEVRVTYTHHVPASVTPAVITRNDESIAAWGERRLEIQPWLHSRTDLQAQIDALSRLRRHHTVTMPLRQASSVPAEVEAGDYIRLRIRDAARNVDIDEPCLVADRAVSWLPRHGLQVRLRCLETGSASPAEPGALLLESGSALLLESGSGILVDA